jgi:hypothetical protein
LKKIDTKITIGGKKSLWNLKKIIAARKTLFLIPYTWEYWDGTLIFTAMSNQFSARHFDFAQ